LVSFAIELSQEAHAHVIALMSRSVQNLARWALSKPYLARALIC